MGYLDITDWGVYAINLFDYVYIIINCEDCPYYEIERFNAFSTF